MIILVYCSLLEEVRLISCLFFFIKIFLYIYNMEQFTKAELYGKVLELQHELKLEKQSKEQLKEQLILSYERNKY